MFFRDLVLAMRALRKSPVFAVTAILTIALGMGASAAIFSVANAVLLRPLPYRNPDRLVYAISDLRKRNVRDFPLSNADFLDLRNGTRDVFEEVAGVATFPATAQREDGGMEQVNFGLASTNLLRTLGAHVVAGREWIDSDGAAAAVPPAGAAAGAAPPQPPGMVILSHAYWQRRFGGSRDIIGKDLPGAAQGGTEVVGVLQPGFELLFPPDAGVERVPDIWFAARIPYDEINRNQVQHRVIARLKDGVTMRQAQAAVDRVTEETRRKFIISGTAGYTIRLEPMHQHIVEEVRPAILALMGAVVFLLLIACANVANLLLVRASLRERELAVRTALGGSWWRLVSQTLAEAFCLAAAGALAGLGLASLGIAELRDIAPVSLPRLDGVTIDPAVIGFTALAAMAAAAIFGLIPAVRAARPDVAQVLRGSSRNVGLSGGGWMRSTVVVAEVALCFVLLVGSGLMFRSFQALRAVEPGFDSSHVLTFRLIGFNRGRQQPAQRAAYVRDLLARLSALPGVEHASASNPFPLAGGFSPLRWGLEPALTDPSRFQAVNNQTVWPGYFDVVRTPLLAGRVFTDADNAPDRNVAVVDQMLAAKAFPGQSAVGKRILIRLRALEPEWVEIIGVVAHQRAVSLAEPGREQIYLTDGYVNYGRVSRFALRTAGDPARLAGPVRELIAIHDRNLALTEMETFDTLVDRAQAGTRFQLLLIGVFATIAAILAGVGLYGVLSTVVRQRTAEIGVRVAMGAQPASIFNLIVGHGLRLSLAGVALGLVAAFVLTSVMTTMLIGVKPTDPATFGAMVVLFLTIAAVSSWLPARRAASLDPTTALRDE
jgi:putative ABC transport system permease protein